MADNTGKTPRTRKTPARLSTEAVMARSPEKTSGPGQTTERAGHEALIDENKDSLKAFVDANEVIMDSMAALGAEMVAFGNKRLRENIERSESLMRCQDAEQALRLQYDFFQSATQQYLAQANNMMEIMARMTGQFWAPLQERTTEALRASDEETP
jgi:hypothetical protein